MAVRTNDEIMQSLRAVIGDDNSDESLTLIEDITDTLSDYQNRTKDSTDWERRYNENDAQWRQRYKERFYSSDDSGTDDFVDEEEEEKPTKMSFEDLFKEG